MSQIIRVLQPWNLESGSPDPAFIQEVVYYGDSRFRQALKKISEATSPELLWMQFYLQKELVCTICLSEQLFDRFLELHHVIYWCGCRNRRHCWNPHSASVLGQFFSSGDITCKIWHRVSTVPRSRHRGQITISLGGWLSFPMVECTPIPLRVFHSFRQNFGEMLGSAPKTATAKAFCPISHICV